MYGAADYFSSAAGRSDRGRHDARRRLAAVGRGVACGRLLEIGPGHGWFATAAVEAGWQVTVVEPCAALAEPLRQVPGLEVIEAPFEQIRVSTPFDAVVAWEVIEHTRQPGHFLSALAEAVGRDGVVGLSTPNLGGWLALVLGERHPMVSPPEHLYYLRYRTLKHWARQHGWRILERSSSSHLDGQTVWRGLSRYVLRQPLTQPPPRWARGICDALVAPCGWADGWGWGTQIECVFQKQETGV